MAGLGFPRDLVVRAYLNGWRDVTSQVRQSEPITITRGKGDRQDSIVPGKMTLVMENDSGDWTPGNPEGQYYGLLGRNTPMDLGFRTAQDTFSRVTANGWGTSSSGHAWAIEGAAAQFATDGSVGTQQVAVTNANVNAWLSDDELFDGRFSIKYTPGFTDVTGGSIEPANIMLRRTDTDNYYMVRLIVTTAEAYQMQVIRRKAGVETTLLAAFPISGLTHTIGQQVTMCAMIEGRAILGKLWLSSGLEPYEWHAIVEDPDDDNVLLTPGNFGVRSGVAAGNTNAKPITFTYDDAELTVVRMAGEIAENTQDWDESHSNNVARLQVLGPLRRLVQGSKTAPLRSTYRRAFDTNISNPPVAYWHCEDGSGAGALSSGIKGHPAMNFFEGNISLASFDGFDCSAPVPTLQDSRWYGTIPQYVDTFGQIQQRCLIYFPDSNTTDGAILTQLYTTGSALRWEINYHTGGGISVHAFNAADVSILSAGPYAFDVDGKKMLMSLELDQNGANIDWRITISEIGLGALFDGGTLAGHTLGRAVDLGIGVGANLSGVAVGHISVQRAISDIFDQFLDLIAWRGEEAGERFQRLSNENNLQWLFFGGNPDLTASMGPQRVGTLLELLNECGAAEDWLGPTLFEARSYFALTFRTLRTLVAQSARTTLNYAGKHIAAPFKPAEGDRGIINDIVVKQTEGSEYRVAQDTGPLNVNDPWADNDGVGRYPTRVEVNVYSVEQLPDIGTFVRTVGTTPEPRFPSVTVNLRAPDLTATNQAEILAANIGDRMIITNLSAIKLFESVDQMVQGYTETFDDSTRHRIMFSQTPYAGYRMMVLDSAEDARLDSNTTTLNEDLDTTETSIDIINSLAANAEPWITTATHPSHFPFKAIFGGERVVVTSATGSGPTYTWTVTRSDNGVVKPHLSGTPVHVAHAVYLGRENRV